MPVSRLSLLLVLLAAILTGADPQPGVDAALRDRLQQFYQLQVDHRFRQAEALVAQDSKDYYYDTQKPELHGFKIGQIRYSADGRSADVTVLTKMTMRIMGAPPTVMDFPIRSKWKLEDGKWCWYIDPTGIDTPFGRMKISPDGVGATPPDLTKAPGHGNIEDVQNAVQPDIRTLRLDPANTNPAMVSLKNTLPGPVTVSVKEESPRLKVEFTKTNLGAGESTQLTVTSVPGIAPRPNKIILAVQPTGQQIQIDLAYTPAK